MPIGLGSGLWAVVLPSEKQNLCLNPSFEYGTSNWGTSTSGTIGTSSSFQQFGAWACSLQPTTGNTDGIRGGVGSMGPGDYGVSCYLRGANGVTYNLEIAPFPTGNALGSTTVVGNGAWQYVAFQYAEPSPGSIARAVVVRKRNSADVTPFYVDGVQVEVGSVTTYIDGDQPGGTWTGAPQNSTSFRSGQYRGGGSVVALGDLGLSVDQMLGVGMPPIEDSSQSYAVTDGAEFQRQRAGARRFALTTKPIVGTSLSSFHVTRRTLIDVFKPDLVTPQQPIRFLYYGGQGTIQLDAYYDKGLELGNMDGPIAEVAAISFNAYDPYCYFPTQQGTTLAPRQYLGSVKFIANRDPLGRWGTMGPSGSALNSFPNVITAGLDGLVYVGGAFGSAGGTRTRFIAIWNPRAGAWGSIVGGTLNSSVNDILQYPDGNLYVTGAFTQAAGTTANSVARYSPSLQQWGTLNGGGVDSGKLISAVSVGMNGLLYAAGSFTQAAGTTANNVAQYNPFSDRWGTMTSGIQNSLITPAFDVITASDGKVYVGGNFGTAGGTVANNVAFWNPPTAQWGTMGAGVQLGGVGGNPFVNVLTQTPNSVIYVGGQFGSAGGGSVAYLGAWNGVQWSNVGAGSLNGQVASLFAQQNGNLVVGGAFSTVGGLGLIPFRGVTFNGASYLAFDADLDYPLSNIDITAMAQSPDGTLYVGMTGAGGSAMVAAVGQVVNKGRSAVYPTLRMRSLSGTAHIYQLLNTTTGNGVYFNYTIQPGEQLLLTLQPGARSFQSSMRGNILSAILPGSNLATLNLTPGTNYISFFSDSDTLENAFFWTPRSWSIDGGTVL